MTAGRRRALRTGAGALLLALAMLSVAPARMLIAARASLRAAESARAQGDTAEAIRGHADALRMYLPFSPYVRPALDGLRDIAATGDAATAQRAWQAVRTSLLATRSFYQPAPDRLAEAEAHLLAARDPTSPPRGGGEVADPAGSAGEGAPAARDPTSPPRGGGEVADPAGSAGEGAPAAASSSGVKRPFVGSLPGRAAAGFLGFVLWAGAAVAFILGGIRSDVRLIPGRTLFLGALFAAGLALYLVGLRSA